MYTVSRLNSGLYTQEHDFVFLRKIKKQYCPQLHCLTLIKYLSCTERL